MERSEKRRLERERRKDNNWDKQDQLNKQWFSQLPVGKKIFIGKFIEHKTIQNDNLVASIMDKCMIGSMDDNTSIDPTLIKKVIKDSNDYILDYKEYLDKEGYEEGFNMIENSTIKEEIKGIITHDIFAGLTKIKCMAKLKKVYNLPAAELSDLWVKCKEELSKVDESEENIEDAYYDDLVNNGLEVEANHDKLVFHTTKPRQSINIMFLAKEHLLEYISKGESKEACIGMVKNEFKFPVNEIEVLWNECMKKSENVQKGPCKSEFKLNVRMIEIEGEFGVYHKGVQGVEIDGKCYANINVAAGDMERSCLNRQEDIATLLERVKTLNDESELELAKFEELKRIFDYK